MANWRDKVDAAVLIEDDVAPAPWEYDADSECILDSMREIIVRKVRPLIGERIVRAVNVLAEKDGILN